MRRSSLGFSLCLCLLAACGDDDTPTAASDAAVDASDGAAQCQQSAEAFDQYVLEHQACSADAECAAIGDCGPNADIRAIRSDVAAQAYEMMKARCTPGTFDGPLYEARCSSGRCELVELQGVCCGCNPQPDASVDAGDDTGDDAGSDAAF
jgi:hypothetical protein